MRHYFTTLTFLEQFRYKIVRIIILAVRFFTFNIFFFFFASTLTIFVHIYFKGLYGFFFKRKPLRLSLCLFS